MSSLQVRVEHQEMRVPDLDKRVDDAFHSTCVEMGSSLLKSNRSAFNYAILAED